MYDTRGTWPQATTRYVRVNWKAAESFSNGHDTSTILVIRRGDRVGSKFHHKKKNFIETQSPSEQLDYISPYTSLLADSFTQ
jgi:hypothetical protein